MDVISYEYTKQRKDFGRHPVFADTKPECLSIRSQRGGEAEKQWIERKTTTVELDCIPDMAEHSVNTERFVQCHRGMQHTAGAWPKDVKSNDVQDKERFLRRIENLPQYATAVRRLTRTVEKAAQQNNSIDLFEQYFAKDTVDVAGEPPSAKTCCVFRDRYSTKRSAVKMCWHPDGAAKLAVAYSVVEFQQMADNVPTPSYIWDVNSPNEPDLELLPQSSLSCLVYNPRTTDHLVGGSKNGVIGFWDLRKGKTPVENSLIEKSHHDPVYDIFWIQSRTGNECCSVSTDGQIFWWDTRKLDAGPTDSMHLKGVLSNGASSSELVYGAMCLDYRSDAGATRYLLGTEQGHGLLVDRKAKKEAVVAGNDSTKSIKTIFGAETGKHHGPIYSIQRHPFASKYFMSVGDWTTRIWMEDIKTPIMATKYDSAYLTNGCWSPTRPGVFYTTKADGTLDVWDLIYKQSDPIFSTKVCDQALTSIKVHQQGRLVALGSQDGSCTILSMGDSLVDQQPNEKQNIIQMFERETKREKNLEIQSVKKRREANQNMRRGGQGAELAAPAGGSVMPTTPSNAGNNGASSARRSMAAESKESRPSSAAADRSPSTTQPSVVQSLAPAFKPDEKVETAIKQAEFDFFRIIEMKGDTALKNIKLAASSAEPDRDDAETDDNEAEDDKKRGQASSSGKPDENAMNGKFDRLSSRSSSKKLDPVASRKALDDGQQPSDA